MYKCDIIVCICCHPPCGGCGLKCRRSPGLPMRWPSPSVWRVWIEINPDWDIKIEQIKVTLRVEGVDWNPGRLSRWLGRIQSPSVWRVWIEIMILRFSLMIGWVTLRVEGVDWNWTKEETLLYGALVISYMECVGWNACLMFTLTPPIYRSLYGKRGWNMPWTKFVGRILLEVFVYRMCWWEVDTFLLFAIRLNHIK